jgi:methyl-accepting chemotaxis protein
MSEDQALARRIDFINLDEKGVAAIRSLKPLVDRALPKALDAFYERIRQFPEVAHFFAESGRIEPAKNAQLRHWDSISSGNFNRHYLESVTRIGQTHARIGLEPRWYIGGYALITEQLIGAVLTSAWPASRGFLKSKPATTGENVAKSLAALVKAVLLDMDFAISTYIEAAEDGRRRAEEASAAAAKQQALVVDAITLGLEHLAKGDLTFRSTAPLAPEYQKVQDDFNAAMVQLQQTIQSIAESTREVAGASAEIASGTTDLSQRTEEQAASLEETSSSMERLSSTVKENADHASQASQFSKSTCEIADRGGAVVSQAVSAMSRIEGSSAKISDIISVIDEIARQTNLLALNAAVEAARAGEAGRGFAVVASEVRSLAQRSSQAAKDIKDLIINSTEQVKQGAELVNKAGTSLTEILESVKKVAEIVSGIATASGEQSHGIEQVNIALTQLDEVTQQNSALVEQNAAAAKALEHQAQTMNQCVSFFRLGEDIAENTPALAGPTRPATAAKSRPVSATNRTAAAASAAPVERSPARRMRSALAAAVNDDRGWQEF